MTEMNYADSLSASKRLPKEEREKFEAGVIELLERIISSASEEALESYTKKTSVFSRQREKRENIKAERMAAESIRDSKNTRVALEKIEEQIIEYESGYSSSSSTRQRFDGMPILLINKLEEHKKTLAELRATRERMVRKLR